MYLSKLFECSTQLTGLIPSPCGLELGKWQLPERNHGLACYEIGEASDRLNDGGAVHAAPMLAEPRSSSQEERAVKRVVMRCRRLLRITELTLLIVQARLLLFYNVNSGVFPDVRVVRC